LVIYLLRKEEKKKKCFNQFRQTIICSIDGIEVDDVGILSVVMDGKIIVNPGLNFVDQRAVIIHL